MSHPEIPKFVPSRDGILYALKMMASSSIGTLMSEYIDRIAARRAETVLIKYAIDSGRYTQDDIDKMERVAAGYNEEISVTKGTLTAIFAMLESEKGAAAAKRLIENESALNKFIDNLTGAKK